MRSFWTPANLRRLEMKRSLMTAMMAALGAAAHASINTSVDSAGPLSAREGFGEDAPAKKATISMAGLGVGAAANSMKVGAEAKKAGVDGRIALACIDEDVDKNFGHKIGRTDAAKKTVTSRYAVGVH